MLEPIRIQLSFHLFNPSATSISPFSHFVFLPNTSPKSSINPKSLPLKNYFFIQSWFLRSSYTFQPLQSFELPTPQPHPLLLPRTTLLSLRLHQKNYKAKDWKRLCDSSKLIPYGMPSQISQTLFSHSIYASFITPAPLIPTPDP